MSDSLRLEHVSKRYGNTVAVDDLSFAVQDKEFVVIFGPAGAGKTTTLNLVAGIATPDRGRVVLAGRVANTLEPSERNIAMVFENYALYPQMTVFENMAFPLKSPKARQTPAAIRARVTQVAATLSIDHLLERPIQALSNGQRQRTALGRALVRRPALFLMDEPLSHLDAKLRHLMRTELKLVQRDLDTPTLYVTHDYLEALSLADRIIVMDGGRALQIGTPDDIYLRPASVAVAQGFGDPEINLLEVSVTRTPTGTLQAVPDGGSVGFPVSAAVAKRLETQRDLQVGFRPADVRISRADEGLAGGLVGSVYSYEPLGARAVLVVKTAQGTFVRALVADDVQPQLDETVSVTVAPHSLIFFERSGGRLLARAEPESEVHPFG